MTIPNSLSPATRGDLGICRVCNVGEGVNKSENAISCGFVRLETSLQDRCAWARRSERFDTLKEIRKRLPPRDKSKGRVPS